MAGAQMKQEVIHDSALKTRKGGENGTRMASALVLKRPGQQSTTKLAQSPSVSEADQLEAKRTANLENKIATLDAQIKEVQAKLEDATDKLNSDPNQTVNHHIKLLREYNDIRDIGTSLMGILANNRQVQMKRIYEDFHVDEKD
ncbi:MAG: hypothetical protein Q9171_005419 [Xanthocarpia ochracea]